MRSKLPLTLLPLVAVAACNLMTGAGDFSIGQAGIDASTGESKPNKKPIDGGGSTVRDEDASSREIPALDASGVTIEDAAPAIPTMDAGENATFFDDFNRGDGAEIGNGWLQKTERQFNLLKGAAHQRNDGPYRNLIVYRPRAEDTLDVEVSVIVSVPNNDADPAVYARLNGNFLDDKQLRGYAFYENNTSDIYLVREEGNEFTTIAQQAIEPHLNVGQSYRLFLRVTGTDPVRLEGTISELSGDTIASLTVSDRSSSRIQERGSVGFGSGEGNNGNYDDFKRVMLDR